MHYAGDVGDLDSIYDLAKKFNLRVIEDAAHAFGSFYKEKLVGVLEIFLALVLMESKISQVERVDVSLAQTKLS